MAKNKGLSMSNFGNDMEQQECALLAYKSVCTWHNYFEKLKFQLLIYLLFLFIFFFFFFLQYCIGFAIYQNESATGIHVFPILNPPPSPYHPSGSSQCTSPKHPVSYISY